MIDAEKVQTLLAMAASIKLGVGTVLPLVPKPAKEGKPKQVPQWRTSAGTGLALAGGVVTGYLFGEPTLGMIAAWIATGSHDLDLTGIVSRTFGLKGVKADA